MTYEDLSNDLARFNEDFKPVMADAMTIMKTIQELQKARDAAKKN